ncbi:MAG: Ig-like domain-containing protein [Reichenbachiella sp.]|uniref:Ig-like domain-containing protein n=1 Tax=Reichenbachiella sp. TaxID=2184521 RepID=UPI003263343F
MNKFKSLTIIALMISTFFVGCNEDDPEIKITSFSFDAASVEVVEGTTVNLEDYIVVEGEDADQANIVFSSDNDEVVSVDGTTLSAVGVGEATVEATETNTNKTATIEVTVIADNIAVTAVSLDTESIDLEIGGTQQLTASITPEDATNKNLTWSVEFPSEGKKSEDDPTAIATVSEEGLVTAVSPGEVVVNVTSEDGEFSASADVIVSGIMVTGITLDQETAGIEIGETLQLTATVSPTDATDESITWSVAFPSEGKSNESSPEDIATVDEDGLVTGVSAGEVVITAETNDGSFTASLDLTVSNVIVTAISISPDPVEVEVNESVQLTATIEPENATDQIVTWSVDMTEESAERVSVASPTVDDYLEISEDGLLTAKQRCDDCSFTATATSNDNGAESTVDVTITYIPVTSIVLSPKSTFEIFEGGTQQMEYTISPSDATDQTVTWEVVKVDNGQCGDPAGRILAAAPTIDDYATIDNEGLLSAHMEYNGECDMLAVYAYVEDLNDPAVSEFEIRTKVTGLAILDNDFQDAGSSIDMPDCSTYQLSVSVTPEGASDQSVTWTSDNTDVLTVDSTGKLSLKGSLPTPTNTTVKVTVTANDGSGVTDVINVVISYNGC